MIKLKAYDKIEKVIHYNFEYISSGDDKKDWIVFKSDRQKIENGNVFENPYPRERFEISLDLED